MDTSHRTIGFVSWRSALPARLNVAAKLENSQRVSIPHSLLTTAQSHNTLTCVVCLKHDQ